MSSRPTHRSSVSAAGVEDGNPSNVLALVPRHRPMRDAQSLDHRIRTIASRFGASRMRRDKAYMLTTHGKFRLRTVKRTGRNRVRARVDRERENFVIKAVRANLRLPSDILSSPPVAYIVTPHAKTRWRDPRAHHASCRDANLIQLLEHRYASVGPRTKLFDGSATTFRKTWDFVVASLRLPPLKYPPACQRAGGCCDEFANSKDITNLMWRMRSTSLSTLKHYLQEVVASSSLADLDEETRHALLAAAKSFGFTRQRIVPKAHAVGSSDSPAVNASADSAHT